MRSFLALASLALVTALPIDRAAAEATGQLVDLRVVDADTGSMLPIYPHRGRLHVPGDPGRPYTVELTNRTHERLLVVLSIDGINVVSGQTASPAQSGYVLHPHQRPEIRGWRKNLAESAEFYFTALPDSYAARTGRPFDVGVIGAAVFREVPRRFVPPSPPIAREREGWSKDAPGSEAPLANQAAPEAKSGALGAPSARQDLGTGHGRRVWDPVAEARFERRSARPDEVVSLFYDSHARLIAEGVIPRRHPRHMAGPNPFPAGFVPDPWR
jgi:hypothetical protein